MISVSRTIKDLTEQEQELSIDLRTRRKMMVEWSLQCNGCKHQCTTTFETPGGSLCVSVGKFAEAFSSLCDILAKSDDISNVLNGQMSRVFVVRKLSR